MKKRMIKKNLKKNKDKNRKKKKNINGEAQISSNASLRSPELQISKNQRVPINAQVVKEHEGWVFHISRNDHSIYLETTDYHADPLRLTMENLHDLIALIEKTK
jgi:hypothetical protein